MSMSCEVKMDVSSPIEGQGTGVIWDFDPNLTSEIYEDPVVKELEDMEEKQEPRKGVPKQKAKNTAANKQDESPTICQGTGVIWDFDPNLTSEIYEDLGVKELEDMEEKQEPRKGVPKQKAKNTAANKSQSSSRKMAVVHTTPRPAAMRTSAKNHIHNGQNSSCNLQCKRRILGCNEQPGVLADSFSYLSDEVVLSIFKWLPKKSLTRCAKVCRRWRQLAYDDELWKRLYLSSRTFRPHILGMILRRGVIAAKLSRSTIYRPVFSDDNGESAMEEDEHTEFIRAPPSRPNHLHLESLDLSACITDDPANIHAILQRCPALKRLSLESCHVNEGALQAVAASGASLQVLNLAMCSLTNDAGLLTLLENAQQLTSLNLSWINIKNTTLQQLTTMLSPSLQHLNLSGYREKLKDQDVVSMVTRCQGLQDLDLSDSTTLTNEALSGIVQNLSCLKHLSLSRCYDIPHYAFVSLTDIKTVKALDVFGVMQPRQLERLRVQMPKVMINSFPFSAIGRPTCSPKQPRHIWGVECGD